MFVKIIVPGYSTILVTDYKTNYAIGADTYQSVGSLLTISDSNSSIRPTQGNMSVTLSGIPNTSIAEVLAQKFKGSKIEVWRVFFDADTGTQLSISGNPSGRFRGIIDNFSLEEDWVPGAEISTNKIVYTCSSSIDVLANKLNGRRTNSNDQKALYPSDVSFDRVVALRNANFNFGAP